MGKNMQNILINLYTLTQSLTPSPSLSISPKEAVRVMNPLLDEVCGEGGGGVGQSGGLKHL